MNTKAKKGVINKNSPKVEVNKASDQELKHEIESLFMSGLQLLESKDEKRHFLIDGIIPGGTIALLCGSSDLGKSIFARQIAVSVALGRNNVGGLTLNVKYKRSIYVTTEDGKADWKEKLQKFNFTPEEKTLLANLNISFDYEQLTYEVLDKLFQVQPVDVMIIDVFADTFTEDLNSAVHVRKYFKGFKLLAEKYGTTFIFVHHLNKRGEGGSPSKLNVLGSGAIEQSMRCVLELKTSEPKDPEYRNLYITKSNYISASEKEKPYKLRLDYNSLTFQYTGERIESKPLLLAGTDPKVIARVLELYRLKHSSRIIADKLREENIQIGKTKVAEIIRDFSKIDNGQDGEVLSAL